MKSDDEKEIRSLGVDTECDPCPECGGYPIRVDYLFTLEKPRKRRYMGKLRIVNKERRSYYHCPCGHCVTKWQRPKYDSKNEVCQEAWMSAREAWRDKKFLKPSEVDKHNVNVV